MVFWTALIALSSAGGLLQAGPDDLRKEIEKLKQQNVELMERLSLLEQGSIEDARTIQRLRQVVKLLENSVPPEPGAPAPKNPGAAPAKPEIAPTFSLKSKLVYVDAKNNFVTLGIGKKDRVEIGFKFEIYRETYENGGESRLTRLGLGQVEKFMGQDSMTKLIITEGNAADMKPDDLAVAIRKLTDLHPVKEGEKPAPATDTPDPLKEGVYTITGRVGQGLVTNYGTILGAKQTQVLFVYKDGKFKAKVRLDKVEKTHSVANVIDGTMELPPDVGDQVYIKELNKTIAGKVALSDEKGGKLAVDLRQRDGIKPGMHLEVRRLGQKIGTVMITEVQNWGSWARPDGDLKIEQIQKGDFVELVEEK